jgi:hypothetical protein
MEIFYSKDSQKKPKQLSYPKRILEALQKGEMTTDELLIELNEPDNKINYLIDGIKKNIKDDKIIKIDNPREKRLWKGHSYKLK